MNICKVIDCKTQVHGHGYCHKHWRRFKKHGDPLYERERNEICKSNYPIEYKTWMSIKERCYNPNIKNYHRYGGRGIIICDEWKNNFQAFFLYIGKKPFPDALIDREDNDGNYEPGNCRWVTAAESAHNRSTNKVNWDIVREIRKRYKNEKITQRKLGILYNVGYTFIGKIVNNKTWKESDIQFN